MVTTKILRWAARILGSLFVLLILVFLIGEGAPNPSQLTPHERLRFAVLGVMLLGLILAWSWAGTGGLLALAGYLLFVLLSGPRVIKSPFTAAGLAGCLHLLAWWTSGRSDIIRHSWSKR